MADISVTAANVVPASGYQFTDGVAGETLTQGQVVYLKAADSRFWKAINSAAATADAVGFVLNGAAAGQPVRVQTGGNINPGGTTAVGVTYCVSGTAGGIALDSDVVSADYKTILGVGTTTSNIAVDINVSGGVIA